MFFDFSWSEIFVVVVVAVIVIGPKELPRALRALGQVIGKLRRTADEFRRHFDETVREAGGEDLQRELHELRHNNPISQIRNTIENTAREATDSVSLRLDEPSSGGQQQTGAQTAADGAKASSAPAPAPKKVSDAAAPTGHTNAPAREVISKDAASPASTEDDAPTNTDKPPLK